MYRRARRRAALRRRLVVGLGALVVVVAAVLGVMLTSGHGGGKSASGTTTTTHPGQQTTKTSAGTGRAAPKPPAVCPLTGVAPSGGSVPRRPALAIKIDNVPQDRPQYGLGAADLVFEVPVEGGITRFIAVYQCEGASQVEPIRSGRMLDPVVLAQLGHVIFAFAGGIDQDQASIASANLFDANYFSYSGAYFRDPNRVAPANLYSSTATLWSLDSGDHQPPAPLFGYSSRAPSGPAGAVVSIPYSSYSDVSWHYDASSQRYVRYYGSQPAYQANGNVISAANVVVIRATEVVLPYVEDDVGSHEVTLDLIGSGPLTVVRNGVAIAGTWQRPSLDSPTGLLDRAGAAITLKPGNTWIELVPSSIPVTAGAS